MICPHCQSANHIDELYLLEDKETIIVYCDNCQQPFDVLCNVSRSYYISKHVEVEKTSPRWIHDRKATHLTKQNEQYVSDDGRIIPFEVFLECTHFFLKNEAWIILPRIVLCNGQFIRSSDLLKM